MCGAFDALPLHCPFPLHARKVSTIEISPMASRPPLCPITVALAHWLNKTLPLSHGQGS